MSVAHSGAAVIARRSHQRVISGHDRLFVLGPPVSELPSHRLAHWPRYGRQSCERVMPKLAEVQLKQVQQLNTANSSPLIRRHKEVLNLMMRQLNLDTYGLTWAQFLKGFGLGGLAVWLLMRG